MRHVALKYLKHTIHLKFPFFSFFHHRFQQRVVLPLKNEKVTVDETLFNGGHRVIFFSYSEYQAGGFRMRSSCQLKAPCLIVQKDGNQTTVCTCLNLIFSCFLKPLQSFPISDILFVSAIEKPIQVCRRR